MSRGARMAVVLVAGLPLSIGMLVGMYIGLINIVTDTGRTTGIVWFAGSLLLGIAIIAAGMVWIWRAPPTTRPPGQT